MAITKKNDWRVSDLPRPLQKMAYEREALAYLESLPLEHFMEATAQATQRKITLESLDLLTASRPEVHVFNELLVQYPVRGKARLGQVVPDNMVVISHEPIEATSSYNVPLEPAAPFFTLEYVSPSNPRMDYEDSFEKYERELKVPYYLLFYPDKQELILHRHNRRRLVRVKPNENGRFGIGELELEVAILDRWVRFWYQGRLLPLPAEMQRELTEAHRRARDQERRANEQEHRANEQERRANEQERRANEEKLRADDLLRQLQDAQKELATRRTSPEQ